MNFSLKSLAALIVFVFPISASSVLAAPEITISSSEVSVPSLADISEALRLNSLGLKLSAQGKLQAALEAYQKSLALFRKISDPTNEGVVLHNIGVNYISLDQYSKALESFQRALPLHKMTNNYGMRGRTLTQIGRIYIRLGEYSKALTSLEEALEVDKAVGDSRSAATTITALGDVYHHMGEASKALELLQQALAICQVTSRCEEGGILDGMGQVYVSLEQYSKAINVLEASLTIHRRINDRELESSTLLQLGKVYRNLNQPQKALELFKQALDISQEVGAESLGMAILSDVGLVYENLGQNSQAIEALNKSLKIAKKIGSRSSEAHISTITASILLDNGDAKAATKLLSNAATIFTSLRLGLTDENKISLIQTQARNNYLLQRAMIAQNRPEVALEIAEQGRARALIELLSNKMNLRRTRDGEPPDIRALNVAKLRQIAKVQFATLVQYSIIGNQYIYIWLIKPSGEVDFRQIDLKSPSSPSSQASNANRSSESLNLSDLVAITRASMGVTSNNASNNQILAFQADPSQMNRQLRRLHQLLIEPIADLLPTDPNQPVIFIPQDALFFVPFPALRDANGKYLIEQHTILTAPSIQVLDLTRQQKSKLAGSSGALVVGNPVMPKGLSSLPNAEAEAKAISALFNTQPLLGAQATKAAVMQKMPQARVIHLATHGLLDNVRGLGSSVALAPSGKDDGLLTAEEILDMKLNADLVVLSACNTGRGRLTGDGVIGLSRSLIAAGVPSVLVSLWSVPDDSTAVLMTQFYQNLQHQPNKAQALRSAMLTMVKANRNPIDWAGFTLIGEAE
jgi:CHAT domain-containing protein/Tfp pilus assembly protein PilF